MQWDGAVTVITGASRGIGRAVAIAAAAKGARVGLVARAKDELDQVLAACGGRGAVVAADVADRVAVGEAFASLTQALGPVDILVNNAGAGQFSTIADTDLETFERLIAVNYLGTVYATKAVLPSMLERGRGHIVNVGSILARIPAPFEGAYGATKFAMAAFSDTLAMEVKGRGIGVSLINPGPVETAFFEARGLPYQRSFPKPAHPAKVAEVVMTAVERNQAERFQPGALRLLPILSAVVPSLFRAGTRRAFRSELT